MENQKQCCPNGGDHSARKGSCGCPCHSRPEGWEEEFDDKFILATNGIRRRLPCHEMIKDFIRQTIEKDRTAYKTRIRERIKEIERTDFCLNPAHGKESHPCDNTYVRNPVLYAVLQALEEGEDLTTKA